MLYQNCQVKQVLVAEVDGLSARLCQSLVDQNRTFVTLPHHHGDTGRVVARLNAEVRRILVEEGAME